MAYDFVSQDVGVAIYVGLNQNIAAATSVSIATVGPAPSYVRVSLPATVGLTTQVINGVSYNSGYWVYYVTGATDFPEGGGYQAQVVANLPPSETYSSFPFAMSVANRI